jgi:hypothetical protein
MPHPFDPGYVAEPFLTLCAEYPEASVYPSDQFRLEWGPIFHRGRLDGSARVLVIGQDPAQHETVVRRILVGEAGRRVQGLLAKLGITRSYVFINTYVFSVYGSVKAKTRKAPNLIDYRNRWLNALLATPAAQSVNVAYAPVTHPTQPESSSKNDKTKLAVATKKLLQNWNAALQALSPSVQHPDVPTPLVLYGESWADGDRVAIPESDFPAGLPAWMHEQDGWAKRAGADDLAKRRNITITVSKGVVP